MTPIGDLTAKRYEAELDAIVSQAPPLTDTQRHRITGYLGLITTAPGEALTAAA